MNTKEFSGRALAYTKARPGYPDEAIKYINALAKPDAVFADIGAGTGKFTELLAQYGHEIFAVEPNADMRDQLAVILASFPNVKIVGGAAEATTLPNHHVDVITNAQALNWFDIEAFRLVCQRIGKPNALVVTLYNYNCDEVHGISRYDKSTGALYRNPTVREFPNPIYFTRDNWILYFLSMAGVPQPSESGYEAYISEINAKFDHDNVDGLLRLDLTTKVYSEVLS